MVGGVTDGSWVGGPATHPQLMDDARTALKPLGDHSRDVKEPLSNNPKCGSGRQVTDAPLETPAQNWKLDGHSTRKYVNVYRNTFKIY